MRRQMHVVPVNDLREHNTKSKKCWCEPMIEEYKRGTLVTHNSLDQRELYEQGKRLPN